MARKRKARRGLPAVGDEVKPLPRPGRRRAALDPTPRPDERPDGATYYERLFAKPDARHEEEE